MVKGLRTITKQSPDPLPVDDSSRSFLHGVLGPIEQLPQLYMVLDGWALDSNREFCHRSWLGCKIIGPELRDSFIERFGLNFNRVRDSLDIGEGNAATGNTHAEIIAYFAFYSPVRYFIAVPIVSEFLAKSKKVVVL